MSRFDFGSILGSGGELVEVLAEELIIVRKKYSDTIIEHSFTFSKIGNFD